MAHSSIIIYTFIEVFPNWMTSQGGTLGLCSAEGRLSFSVRSKSGGGEAVREQAHCKPRAKLSQYYIF